LSLRSIGIEVVLDSSGQSTFQSKVHIDMPCYIPAVGVFSIVVLSYILDFHAFFI
jgi:hypothetical protein